MSKARITISFTDLSEEQKGSIQIEWDKDNNTQYLSSKREALKQGMSDCFKFPRKSLYPELFEMYIKEMSELPFKVDEDTKKFFRSAGREYVSDRDLDMVQFRYLPHFKSECDDSSLCLNTSLYTCRNKNLLPLVESLLKITIPDFNNITQFGIMKCASVLRVIFDYLSQPFPKSIDNPLIQEFEDCAYKLLNEAYKECSTSQETHGKTLHAELMKTAVYKKLYEQDQIKLIQIKAELDTVITAINKEINRLDHTINFFTIGKGKKSSAITKALNNAIKKAGNVDQETFLNYKLDGSLSIKEALNSPRRWPGLKPLRGQSDAWSNVEKVSLSITDSKKNTI